MYRQEIMQQPKWVALAVALGCAVAAGLLGPIAIEVKGEAPLTAQTLLVLLPPLLFGWEVGFASALLYLLAGGLGLPVFAHFTGGWERFTGTTGGYLLAFPIAALIIGWMAPSGVRFRFLRSGGLLLLGQILILSLGMSWQRNIVPMTQSIWESIEPLVPGLIIKTAAGTLILTAIGRIADRTRRT